MVKVSAILDTKTLIKIMCDRRLLRGITLHGHWFTKAYPAGRQVIGVTHVSTLHTDCSN